MSVTATAAAMLRLCTLSGLPACLAPRRSVSVCPPAFYADLAATRGRLLLQCDGGVGVEDAGSLDSGGSLALPLEAFSFKAQHSCLQHKMYYV